MSAQEKIEGVLAELRPALRIDGGDVEFVDYDETSGIVQLRLMGACGSCPISMMTLKQGIEKRLADALPDLKEVRTLS